MQRAQPTAALMLLLACLTGHQGACSSEPAEGSDGTKPTPDSGLPPTCSSDLRNDGLNCGACGNACGPLQQCEGGACVPSCGSKTLYVSPEGDDRLDGCSPERALRSIAGAVSRARSIGAEGFEVHICRGTYREKQLVLDYPVSLLGGYDCKSFARDPSSQTLVVDGNDGGVRTALTVRGSALTRSVRIEALKILAARYAELVIGKTTQITGLAVLDGASPTLASLVIEGGETNAKGTIVGLDSKNSSPDIGNVQVLGGFASDPGGSRDQQIIGLRVVGGSPLVHNSSIRGAPDNGAKRAGTVYGASVSGVRISDADSWHDVAFAAGHSIIGGSALRIAGSSKLSVSTSTFAGPKVYCLTTRCAGSGIETVDSEVNLTRSLVASGVTTGGPTDSVAVDAVRSRLSVTNNVVLAQGWFSADVTAIAVRGGAARIVHNTLLAHAEILGGSSGSAVAIRVTQGATGVDVIDNLIVSPSIFQVGLRLDGACDGFAASSFHDVRANAFVNLYSVLELHEGAPCASSFTGPASKAEAALVPHASGVVGSNTRLTDSCVEDEATPWCRTCATLADCASSVVVPWLAGASPSPTELFAAPGYSLPVNAPCAVVRGGVPAGVATDLKGVARGPNPSIGASEHATGATCAP